MLQDEFDSRTRAKMNLVLQQTSRDLPQDDYQSRKFVANSMISCARSGRTTLGDLTTAARLAAIELIAEADRCYHGD